MVRRRARIDGGAVARSHALRPLRRRDHGPVADRRGTGAAYARYRPESGRFSGIGDALLRRTRARLAARVDRLTPAGAVLDVGAGDGALLDALSRAGPRGARASSATRGVRTCARPTSPRSRESGRRSSSGTRSSTCPRPGAAIDEAARRLRAPAASLLVAVPNTRASRRARSGIAGSTSTCRATSSTSPAAALTARLRALGLTVDRVSHWRGGQVVFGWLHGLVGTLPGRPDLYDAIRRPEARSAPDAGAAAARWRWRAADGAAPGRRACRRRRGRRCGAAAPSTSRRVVAERAAAGEGRSW